MTRDGELPDQSIKKLPKEKENGNVEYKLRIHLSTDDQDRKEKFMTQLLYRLNEGSGEAIYEIGVTDDGEAIGLPEEELQATLDNLKKITLELNAEMSIIRIGSGIKGKVAELLIRRIPDDHLPITTRIVTIGNVDSGKSTMLGCLITGQHDDGDGSARQVVFRHPHELNSGRTSSVAMKILGFDAKGTVTNYYPDSNFPPRSHVELLSKSSKLIRFIDLAGHEKYLRTTIFGLTGQLPDYSCILLAANQGILPMTREHLGLSAVMKIPFFFVISKIDLTPAPVLKATINSLKRKIKSIGVSRVPLMVKDINDIMIAMSMIRGMRVVPIFLCSFVTGEGMDLLTNFLNLLPVRYSWDEKERQESDFLLYIDEIFNVTGVGLVVSGLVQRGRIARNDKLLLGPDEHGQFREVRVRSIQHRRMNVTSVAPGQFVTFALALGKNQGMKIRKGQVLTTEEQPRATWKFEGDILLLHHATTLKDGYNAHIHSNTVRQTARLKLSKEYLRTGDRATCEFKFLFHPEYLIENSQFLFREGRTRGIGTIKKRVLK